MKNTQALPADVPMNGIINPQKTVIDMGYFFSFRYLVAMTAIHGLRGWCQAAVLPNPAL
jgi:hypothetical protein